MRVEDVLAQLPTIAWCENAGRREPPNNRREGLRVPVDRSVRDESPEADAELTPHHLIHEKIERGHETLLLLDDEAMILDVGQEILKELGYAVLIARGGKEAIEIYEENKDTVDVVILDMIMPGMGGGETYDRLKKISPDIKVLLSSGYSIDGQAQEILDRGCDGFIQKPFNVKELSQEVRKILDS